MIAELRDALFLVGALAAGARLVGMMWMVARLIWWWPIRHHFTYWKVRPR